MSETPPPTTIGRFRLVRTLGAGLQGKVYLALDPNLRRKVAIKVLNNEEALLDLGESAPTEAVHLAELRHPNIVSVFEVGMQHTLPYIVCEYVEGEPLREVLAAEGPLSPRKALTTLRGVLEGMAHAHSRDVCHLDLSPSNLMIDSEGVPRVMDFGLSRKNTHRTPTGDTVFGALAYMAPEHLRAGTLDARTDVYALGLIAYELLTGLRANSAKGKNALFRQILSSEADPAPLLDVDSTGQLAEWIRTATQKDPHQRYADAGAMLEAFNLCSPVRAALGGTGTHSDHAAVEYLLFRMRRKKDFPALSNTLLEINRMAAEDSSTPVATLANNILCDYALTNKLLKLANSAFFGSGGRSVKSVSDAIRVLGMSHVRQACTALMSLQQFDGALDNEELVDVLSASFTAGLVARHVAPALKVPDAEQAFIAGLFQGMGRSLAIYHFPREHAEVKEAVAGGTLTWPEAQIEVLGVTYQEIGRSVARLWGFPEPLLGAMAPWRGDPITAPATETDALFQAATFANRLCSVCSDERPEVAELRLTALVGHFEQSLPLTVARAADVLQGAVEKFRQLAPVLGLANPRKGFVERTLGWLLARRQTPAEEVPRAANG
jgi:serine/threonine protein kinase